MLHTFMCIYTCNVYIKGKFLIDNTSGQVYKKLTNISHLQGSPKIYPAIPPLSTYPRKINWHMKAHCSMFIIAEEWKQPNLPSTSV